MSILHTTSFFKSENNLENLPKDSLPEICFVGRSNSGKSTIINSLTNKRKLAFSSKLPGRTRLINIFKIYEPKFKSNIGYIVDLPGYGYASVSNDIKQNWGNILNKYLNDRKSLSCLILIIDIRRGLTNLDYLLINSMKNSFCKKLVLINKIDKLRNEKRKNNITSIRKDLEKIETFDVIEFSSLSKIGIKETTKYIEKIIYKNN